MTIDVSSWGWPQWTMVGLLGVGLLMKTLLDGKPRTGNHSVGVHLVEIGVVLMILVSGGFFS